MSTQQAFKEKMYAQVQLWEAKLSELKAQIVLATADQKLKYQSQVGELENKVQAAQVKLSGLKESGENAWEEMKDGVEHAFKEVKEAADKAADAFRS